MNPSKNSVKTFARLSSSVFFSGILLVYSPLSFATKCFTWEASLSEKGYFITNDGADLGGGSTNYTIDTMKVTATSVSGVNSSTNFTVTQPTLGFTYNGTAPTQFWRSGGTLTNGSNLFDPSNRRWSFDVNYFKVQLPVAPGTTFASSTSLTVTLDATGVACIPPLSINAPIDFSFNNKQPQTFASEIEFK